MAQQAKTGKIEMHNHTAYAMISNLGIALDSQVDNRFIGTGLNTHFNNYERYHKRAIYTNDYYFGTNAKGAGSIFIRVLSEFGLLGFVLFLFFLYKYTLFTKNYTYIQLINHMSLLSVIHFSTRSGHYVSIPLLLGISLLYITYILHLNTESLNR